MKKIIFCFLYFFSLLIVPQFSEAKILHNNKPEIINSLPSVSDMPIPEPQNDTIYNKMFYGSLPAIIDSINVFVISDTSIQMYAISIFEGQPNKYYIIVVYDFTGTYSKNIRLDLITGNTPKKINTNLQTYNKTYYGKVKQSLNITYLSKEWIIVAREIH